MTHDEVSDLLSAHALGVLSAEEQRGVQAHLESCQTCADEARRLQAVSDQLALVAPEREPPAALRSRLMSLVELDREQWLREHVGNPNGASPAPIPLPSKPIPWWTRLPRLAYGAAAVVAAAAVLIVVVLAHRPGVTVRTYHTDVAASVVKGVPLRGVTAAVDVRSDHTTRVHFTNLPVLPPSLAYELWLIPAHGSPVPVDGFEVRAGQAFSQTYGKDASGYSAAAVSIERAPGHWPAPSPNGVAFEVVLGA